MSNNILKGLKVVELGTHVAIPYFTRVLGDWGAEVVKIEPPRGESYRHIGKLFRMPHEEENNVMYIPYNINKKSLCMNLKNQEGMEVLEKLLEDADIFATNTRSAALEKMGLSFEKLKEKYPQLIIVHLNGFGKKGEEKNRPGFDLASFWCRGGAISEWTNKGERPFKPFFGFGDAITSSQLLSGALGALYNREKTGKGDLIDVSLYSAGLWTNVGGVVRGQHQFGQTFPQSRMEPLFALDNFYKTKDGKYILICEELWEKKCDAYFDLLGKPELKGNPDYCTLMGTYQRLPEMVELFDKGFAEITSQELVEMLTKIDTVFEFITSPEELYKDKQAWDNDYLREVETPGGNKFIIPTNPVSFESQGMADCNGAPLLGEDSIEILKGLGYSDEQIELLIKDKTVLSR